MDYTSTWNLPVIFINGTHGNQILDNIHTTTIDYQLTQQLNTSVTSYNIIGQLNGTDPTKTIILDSLYDSVWTQGTADSAIGMSIVLGIAKYYTDNNITPKYNIQFIAFCGEEYGFRGALYHEATHKNQNIHYLIDLNQLGFTQTTPPLYLELISNNKNLLDITYNIAQHHDYTNITQSAGIRKHYMPRGAPSNDQPFARNRKNCNTITLLKGLNWVYHHRDGLNHTEGDTIKYHHRDGLNHTEGDTIKYYNHTDVTLTSHIVLDLIKHLTL
jgi:hypothetical protein